MTTISLYDPNLEGDWSGVYSKHSPMLPKYNASEGRDKLYDLTVARIYLTGLTPREGISATDLGMSVKGLETNLFRTAYVGFILQSVSESHQEKIQLAPLNGDKFAAYFLGEQPVVYSFSGQLLNTFDDDWRTIFSELYQTVFRGSAVAKSRRLVQVAYDDKIVTGAMISLQQQLTSEMEAAASFEFQLLVYHTLETSLPTKDRQLPSDARYRGTFRGRASEFAGVTIGGPIESVDNVVTAFVTPPPKPRKPKKSGKRSSCKVTRTTSRGSGATSEGTSQQKAQIEECLKGVAKEKTLAKKITAINALAKKLKKDLGSVPGDVQSEQLNLITQKKNEGIRQMATQLVPGYLIP